MKGLLTFVRELVEGGGPRPSQFAALEAGLARARREDAPEIRRVLAPTLVSESMQGLAYLKPHGYPGDYEMIDRIFTDYRAPDPALARWDGYFQTRAAPRAVRNRKAYLHRLLDGLPGEARVLVAGSGGGRDLGEYLRTRPDRQLQIEAVETDPAAVAHAKMQCAGFEPRVRFERANPARWEPSRKVALAWCPGLFDYFSDPQFHRQVERLFGFVEAGGELVIGNFSPDDPTRPYMELVGDWHLQHRGGEQLQSLAESAVGGAGDIQIGREPAGVNLFLHVRRE
ncbi:MAG: hypothetical protein OER86_09835 [Phycisphaerae bacterium]|nr:hypothetical protein [Phycisphaerae bacterium]